MLYGNLLFFLIVGVVIYLMLRKGGGCCGGHDHGDHDHGDQDHAGHEHGGHGSSFENQETGHSRHHMQAETTGSVTETDPVCGMQVTDDTIASDYLGRTFHFCSEQCKKLFNLNPNKYADASQGN